MPSTDPYDNQVGARLLDFFGVTSPWHRRLWSAGIVLTLKEILEASEAVRASVLHQQALDYLISSAKPLSAKDPGIGDNARLTTLHQALRTEKAGFRLDDLNYHKLQVIIEDLEVHYLERWAQAVNSPANRPGVERTARAVASHLLDSGFDPDYLHHWWMYRITHEPGTRRLADWVTEAHHLCQQPERPFEILVAFEGANLNFARTIPGWLDGHSVSRRLQAEGFDTNRLRQNGGLLIQVTAREARSAVHEAAEIVDRFISRTIVGTRDGKLRPTRDAWVMGEGKTYPLRGPGRGVEVHALERGRKLYVSGRPSRVDAAIELLTPMARSSPGPAIGGAWAAIESMLSTPGDERVLGGDRMAVLVACSFPRAELTSLSYKVGAGSPVFAQLGTCGSNRDRCAVVAGAIKARTDLNLTDQSDLAAVARMQKVLADPHKRLEDVKDHLTTTFRRLYRHRNMILHWGKTDAVALRSCLRTTAPLVGEGIDRIAHASFVDNLSPIELAARASVGLAIVGTTDGPDVIDLLHG